MGYDPLVSSVDLRKNLHLQINHYLQFLYFHKLVAGQTFSLKIMLSLYKPATSMT